MKKNLILMGALAALAAGSFCGSAYGQKVKIYKSKPAKQKAAAKKDDTASAEPDKVLYDRAVNEVKRSHYTESRLDFQTLINTYPDSEYLAKAKLGVADSYYKEGGTSNLTLAVGEYKNFIVFFPFLDEAGYAQMQVGMAHYRMMEKADRDNSQALAAEQEFQTFLLKYPQSPLVPKAEQDLRNVQEVLADGEYRIARFYYLKPYYPAAAARLVELSERYPLYSESDEALWMLGDIYVRAKKASKSEDQQNHWADLAAICYSRIVQDYPTSRRAPEAKAQLAAMGMHVPATDPGALARMRKDQLYAKDHHPHAYSKLPLGMIRSQPDVYTADRYGEPNLNPPDDVVSAKDVLAPDAPGPVFDSAAKPSSDNDTSAQGNGDTPPVEAETSESSGTTGMTAGAQIIEAPTGNSTAQPAAAPPSAPPAAAPEAPAAATSNPGPSTLTVLPDSASNSNPATVTSVAPAAPTAPASAAAAVAAPTPTKDAPAATPSQNGTAADASNAQSNAPVKADKSDPKAESTSKKKKGLKKVIPW